MDYGNKNPHACHEPGEPKDIHGSEPVGSAGEFSPGSMEASRNPNGTGGSLSVDDVFSGRKD